jgi:hypothetical protein
MNAITGNIKGLIKINEEVVSRLKEQHFPSVPGQGQPPPRGIEINKWGEEAV